jgi:hypothetical protein
LPAGGSQKGCFTSESLHRELPSVILRRGALHRKARHAAAWLRAFLFLSLMSKLNGFKTKKPWHFVPGFSL